MPVVLPRAWIKIKMDILSFHSLEHRPSIHFFLILSDFIVFFQNPTRFHATVFPAVLTSHFSPLIPLMCAILPWNQYAGQFPFPCVFLTDSLFQVFISKVEKQSAEWLGGTQLFSFPEFCQPERPETPQNQRIMGWQIRN